MCARCASGSSEDRRLRARQTNSMFEQCARSPTSSRSLLSANRCRIPLSSAWSSPIPDGPTRLPLPQSISASPLRRTVAPFEVVPPFSVLTQWFDANSRWILARPDSAAELPRVPGYLGTIDSAAKLPWVHGYNCTLEPCLGSMAGHGTLFGDCLCTNMERHQVWTKFQTFVPA
eukprot:3097806-Rhodomonas_salina.2